MTPLVVAGGPAIFQVLAAFVAINTSIYAGLALVKSLPRPNLSRFFSRSYRRAETRSIHPLEGWEEPPPSVAGVAWRRLTGARSRR